MKYNLNNKKLGNPCLYWSKFNPKTKQSASVLIKCGDCDNKVRICYDDLDKKKYTKAGWKVRFTEINGVIANNDFWQQLFKELKII